MAKHSTGLGKIVEDRLSEILKVGNDETVVVKVDADLSLATKRLDALEGIIKRKLTFNADLNYNKSQANKAKKTLMAELGDIKATMQLDLSKANQDLNAFANRLISLSDNPVVFGEVIKNSFNGLYSDKRLMDSFTNSAQKLDEIFGKLESKCQNLKLSSLSSALKQSDSLLTVLAQAEKRLDYMVSLRAKLSSDNASFGVDKASEQSYLFYDYESKISNYANRIRSISEVFNDARSYAESYRQVINDIQTISKNPYAVDGKTLSSFNDNAKGLDSYIGLLNELKHSYNMFERDFGKIPQVSSFLSGVGNIDDMMSTAKQAFDLIDKINNARAHENVGVRKPQIEADTEVINKNTEAINKNTEAKKKNSSSGAGAGGVIGTGGSSSGGGSSGSGGVGGGNTILTPRQIVDYITQQVRASLQVTRGDGKLGIIPQISASGDGTVKIVETFKMLDGSAIKLIQSFASADHAVSYLTKGVDNASSAIATMTAASGKNLGTQYFDIQNAVKKGVLSSDNAEYKRMIELYNTAVGLQQKISSAGANAPSSLLKDMDTTARELSTLQEQILSTINASKGFDKAFETQNALNKIDALKKSLKGFNIDLTKVTNAAKNIVDQDSKKIFDNLFKAASQQGKDITSTVGNINKAEQTISNMSSIIGRMKAEISQFSGKSGADLSDIVARIERANSTINKATSGTDRANIYKEINNALVEYTKRLGQARAEQSQANREQVKQKAGVKEITSLYSRLLQIMQQLNVVDSSIAKLKLKDGGSGIFNNTLNGLEQQRENLLNGFKQLKTQIDGMFSKGVVGNNTIPLNFTGSAVPYDVANSISAFFADSRVQNALPIENVNKFSAALEKSKVIASDFAITVTEKFSQITQAWQTIMTSMSNGSINPNNSLYKTASAQFNTIQGVVSGMLTNADGTKKAIGDLSAKELADINALLTNFDANVKSIATRIATNEQYFANQVASGKLNNKGTAINNLSSGAISSTSTALDSDRKAMEAWVRTLQKGQVYITGFNASTDGLRKSLTYSMWDAQTKSMQKYIATLNTLNGEVFITGGKKNSTSEFANAQKQANVYGSYVHAGELRNVAINNYAKLDTQNSTMDLMVKQLQNAFKILISLQSKYTSNSYVMTQADEVTWSNATKLVNNYVNNLQRAVEYQRNFGIESAKKANTKANNVLASLANIGIDVKSSAIPEVTRLETAMSNMNSAINNPNTTQSNYSKLAQELNVCASAVEKMVNAQSKLTAGKRVGAMSFDGNIDQTIESLKRYRAGLASAQGEVFKFKSVSTDASTGVTTFSYSLRDAQNNVRSFQDRFSALDSGIYQFQTGMTKAQSTVEMFTSGMRNKFVSLMQYLSWTTSIYSMVSYMRRGLTTVKEIEAGLAQLQIVTGETGATLQEFGNTAITVARQVGTEVTSLISSVETWSRLGYSLKDSLTLAETTAQFSNVANTTVEEATTSLTAILKGYGKEASDITNITDMLTVVGQKYAVSASEIGEALQRGGAALAVGGNSLEQSVALVAAGNAATQNAEAVGTALKTLQARLRGAKTELEEMGEDTDTLAVSTSKLQADVLGLTHGVVNIMESDGQTFKSTYDILLQIAEIWDTLNDIDQASLLEIIAGKRQASIVASIIGNVKDLKGAYTDAQDSAGATARANEIYLDTIEGKTKQLATSASEMWQTIFKSDIIKFFVDLLNIITQTVSKMGVLGTAFTAVIATLSIKNKKNPLTVYNDLFWGAKDKVANTVSNAMGTANNAVATTTYAAEASAIQTVTKEKMQLAMATAQVTTAKQAEILTSMGLTNADMQTAISLNELNAAKIEELTLNGQLTYSQGQLLASQLGITMSNEYGALAALEHAMAVEGLDIALSKEVMTELQATASSEALTNATIRQALASRMGVSAENERVNAIMARVNAEREAIAVSQRGASVAKSLAKSLLVGAGITVALMALPYLLDKIPTATKVAEKATKAIDDYKQSISELDNTKSTIDGLSTDYETLSKGVDSFGNNINLSTSQYERYNEITKEIASRFPEMVAGYTSEGNAIIKHKGDVEALTEAYQKLRNEADNKLINEYSDVYQDYQYKTKGGFWQWDRSQPDTFAAMSTIEKMLNDKTQVDSFIKTYKSFDDSGVVDPSLDRVVSELAKRINREDGETKYDFIKRAFEEELPTIQSMVNNSNVEFNAILEQLKPGLQAYANQFLGRDSNANLTTEQKNLINTLASNVNKEFFDGLSNSKEVFEQMDAMMSTIAKNKKLADTFTFAINLQTKLDNNEVKVDEYLDSYNKILSNIDDANLDEVTEKQIKLTLGIDKDGKNDFIKQVDLIRNQLTRQSDKDLFDLNYRGLKKSDIQIIADNLDKFKMPNGVALTYEKFYETFKKVKAEFYSATTPAQIFKDNISELSQVNSTISSLKEAYDKLQSGTFELDDLISLAETFPEIADGVDITSESFDGLATNLRIAEKSAPDNLIKKLKSLRDELKSVGKDTSAIDLLIEKVENIPTDTVETLAEQYITLADAFNKASKAQNDIKTAMDVDWNKGFDTRMEAIDTILTLLGDGAIGNTSELWDIAEAFFGKNSQAVLKQDADALWEMVKARKAWYASGDESGFSQAKSFAMAVEQARNQSEELQKILTWDYDESIDSLKIDYDNENVEKIVSLLAELNPTLGITVSEWMDMNVEVGRFFNLQWEDINDVTAYLNNLNSQLDNTTDGAKKLGKAIEATLGQGFTQGITSVPLPERNDATVRWYDSFDYNALNFSTYGNAEGTQYITISPILPDGSILDRWTLERYAQTILRGESIDADVNYQLFDSAEAAKQGADTAEQFRKAYLQKADSLNILSTVDNIRANPNGSQSLRTIAEIQDAFTDYQNTILVNEEKLHSALSDLGYDETIIQSIKNALDGLQNGGYTYTFDFLGLEEAKNNVDALVQKLEGADAGIKRTENADGTITIDIDIKSYKEAMAEMGYTPEAMQAYLNSIMSVQSEGIEVHMANGTMEDICAEAKSIDEAIEVNINDKEIKITVDDASKNKSIRAIWDVKNALTGITDKTVTITTKVNGTPTTTNTSPFYSTTTKSTGTRTDDVLNTFRRSFGFSSATGTARAMGGNTLVGEVGEELVVSPHENKYYTVGKNGAEFVDLPEDAIVFNHRQTKELLKNGYTSRGTLTNPNMAFATGNAFVTANAQRKVYGTGQNSNTSKSSKNSSEDGSSKNNGKDDSTKQEEAQTQTLDYITIILENLESRIKRNISALEDYLDDTTELDKKNAQYNELVALELQKANTNLEAQKIYSQKANELLAQVPEAYREKAQNGALAIEDFVGEANGKVYESISKYREWANKELEAEAAYYDAKKQMSEYRMQEFEDIKSDYDNLDKMLQAKQKLTDSRIKYLETAGRVPDDQLYIDLINSSKTQMLNKTKERDNLMMALSRGLESGDIVKYTDAYYEMQDAIHSVGLEITDLSLSMEEALNSINDNKWKRFDWVVEQIQNVNDEISNLQELMAEKPLFDEGYFKTPWDGWTDEGVASIATMGQQLELAEVQSRYYADAIKELKETQDKYSPMEYASKLKELKDGQYGCIKAYNDARKAIKQLAEQRVEAIKTAIDKEIEAYTKLINKRKEALQSSKDEHDWNKSVTQQQKKILDLQREIDAMKFSTDAGTVAKRKKLEADLITEQANMGEMYYDHSIDLQNKRLDKELEVFTDEKNAEKERLDEYLKDTEKVIADALKHVKDNTTSVFKTLTDTSSKFGLNVTDCITEPWKDGNNALANYDASFTTYLDKWIIKALEFRDSMAEALNENPVTGDTGGVKVKIKDPLGNEHDGYLFDNGVTYTKNIKNDKYRLPDGWTMTDTGGQQWQKQALGSEKYDSSTARAGTGAQVAIWDSVADMRSNYNSPKTGYVYNGKTYYKDIEDPNQLVKNGTVVRIANGDIYEKTAGGSNLISRVDGNVNYYLSQSDYDAGRKKTGYIIGGVTYTQPYASPETRLPEGGIVVFPDGKRYKMQNGKGVAFAKGSKSIPKDMLALVDELGEEMQLVPNKSGRLDYLKKGTGVIPADMTERLMEWGKLNPNDILKDMIPQVSSPNVIQNNTDFKLEFGSLVHVDTISKDTLPDLQKMVRNEFNNMMGEVNSKLRRYTS